MSDDTDQVDPPAAPDTEGKQPSAEDRARLQGWRPKEEYKGPPEKWKSAEDFLAVGEDVLPVATKRNAALEKQNAKLLSDLAEIRSTMRDLVAGQKAQSDRAVASAIANLKAQKKIAVEQADTTKVDAIDDQIDALKEEPKANGADKAKERSTEPSPEWSEEERDWIKRNPWMSPKSQYYDPYLARTALGYYDVVDADPETQDLGNAEKLKLVSAEMRRRFPEKFQNAKRKEPNSVESGNGSSPRGTGKKSFSDLPAEAQVMARRLVAQKVFKSVDEYISQYQW